MVMYAFGISRHLALKASYIRRASRMHTRSLPHDRVEHGDVSFGAAALCTPPSQAATLVPLKESHKCGHPVDSGIQSHWVRAWQVMQHDVNVLQQYVDSALAQIVDPNCQLSYADGALSGHNTKLQGLLSLSQIPSRSNPYGHHDGMRCQVGGYKSCTL